MEILGHYQMSVTLNTYTHVEPALNWVAADRMEEALWPGNEDVGLPAATRPRKTQATGPKGP